jgi:ABC-type uncharacterized transport system substrate-binding protein
MRPSTSLRAAVFVLALAGSPAAVATAHPHVFVDISVGVRFGDHGFEGIQLAWEFDAPHSSFLLYSFADRSGTFSAQAVQDMERLHVRETQPLGFFLEVHANGAPVPVTTLRDFTASVERARVTYAFIVPVSPPPSNAGVVEINVVDPGAFTAFTVIEPVRVDVPGPYRVECRLARDPDTRRPEGIRCEYRRADR